MQISYNGNLYEITSKSTIKNIETLKTLVEHGIKLEDIKFYDKASDLLPEIFNEKNDVNIGDVLRHLRYQAKTNNLTQILKDFLKDYGYNFNIKRLRADEQSQQYAIYVIEILQIFVDNGIDLNAITQRTKAKDVLPSKFNEHNDLNIGAILQYVRTKFKNKTLPKNIEEFLIKHNFKFEKETSTDIIKRTLESLYKVGVNLNEISYYQKLSDFIKTDASDNLEIGKILYQFNKCYRIGKLSLKIQNFLSQLNYDYTAEKTIPAKVVIKNKQPKQQNKTKTTPAQAQKSLKQKTTKGAAQTKKLHTAQNLPLNAKSTQKNSSKQDEQGKIYNKSSNKPRKKYQIIKLIVAKGVDLNNLQKTEYASQLLPAKTITSEEDFCIGKIIYNAKIRYARGKLNPSAYNILTKFGVTFNEQKSESLISMRIKSNQQAIKLDNDQIDENPTSQSTEIENEGNQTEYIKQ